MHQPRDLAGEYPLGLRTPFALGVSSLDLRNIGNGQKSEITQESVNVGIRRAQPELIKGVRRGSFRVQPNGARLSLTEFCAIRLGHQWQCQPEHLPAVQAASEINTACDIAPLIRAADLQAAAVQSVQL